MYCHKHNNKNLEKYDIVTLIATKDQFAKTSFILTLQIIPIIIMYLVYMQIFFFTILIKCLTIRVLQPE